MATGVYSSEACLLHDTGAHPESRARLEAVMERLRAADLPGVDFLDAPAADLALVRSVHTPSYIDRVVRKARQGGGMLDAGDTIVSPGSLEAALHAVGAAVEAAEAVVEGRLENAFAAVRPPGHHATPSEGMGFCIFNNLAIAARNLLDRGLAKRIAVVDFDVHHGNGTQAIFCENPAVLFFSTHQIPLFPGSGHYREVGRGEGEGFTVNVPLAPGVGDQGYLHVADRVLAPLLRRYRPDIVLVSAGYDPYWMDPLASMSMTVPGFHRLAVRIRELAGELCGGRMAWVLEGGYDLKGLVAGVEASVRVLSGSGVAVEDPYGAPVGAGGVDAVEGVVSEVRRLHGL
jgi:acetoin utilization deacetylase AcuC-like enzyme